MIELEQPQWHLDQSTTVWGLSTDVLTQGSSSGGDSVPPLTNIYYVDSAGNDSTGDGSIGKPYLTIQKALDVIGSATNNTDWQAVGEQAYIVNASPADYIEDLVFPFRPYLRMMVDGVTLTGDHTLAIGDQMNGGGITSPQLVFASDGVRELWPDIGVLNNHGIIGNLTVTSTSTTSNFFQVNYDHCGITGSTSLQGAYSGGQVRFDSALQGGQTIGPLSGSSIITVWARGAMSNPDFGDVHGIGGISGNCSFGVLNNVLISNDCDAIGILPNQWYGVRFLAGKDYDFSLQSGIVGMDANTFAEVQEFTAPVGSAPPPNINLIDLAEGIKAVPFDAITSINVQAQLQEISQAEPNAHAASHTNGVDDIQSATAVQKGVATAAQITKLDGIETGATTDQTNAEIIAAIRQEETATSALDFDGSLVQYIPITANTVFTFTNIGDGKFLNLSIEADGTLRTTTFPTVAWMDADTPASVPANEIWHYSFWQVNGIVYGAYRKPTA